MDCGFGLPGRCELRSGRVVNLARVLKEEEATSAYQLAMPGRSEDHNPKQSSLAREATFFPYIPTDLIAYTLTVSNTFNSLFKVLFTFPSRYLCPIGFLGIFSLGRNLPPVKIALSSNPTLGKRSVRGGLQALYGAVTLHGATFQWTSTWATRWTRFHKLHFALDEPRRLPAWAFPRSLAVTRGILFSFFSSPYLYA